jgi:hypothetical protein
MTTGKCENSANLNAETMGQILRISNKIDKWVRC